MTEKIEFTKYEKTRVLGARALQISMDAPLLMEVKKERLEELKYNPMSIANEELEANVLPITVKKPMPKRKSVKIKRTVVQESEEKPKEGSNREVSETEEMEEKEIVEEGGEIMELANPDDEEAGEEAGGREASEELQ